MSTHSRRPRPTETQREPESAARSEQAPGMSNSQAILESEASQNPFQAIGSFFQNLFSGGQRGPTQSTGSAQQQQQQPQQQRRVSRVQTGMGADIDQGIVASPSLANRVNDILANGWTIRWSRDGERGSFCNRSIKTIVVNRSHQGNVHGVVGTIAHEVGHASTPLERHSRRDPNYANKMVRAHLRNEAEAIAFNIECALETDEGLFDREDMGVRAPAGCRQVYEQYRRGQVSREDMINRMADLVGRARPSTAPHMNYTEYYAQYYR